MKLPPFLKQVDQSLLYADTGELLFFVPEPYFVDVKKNPIAQVAGQYVSLLGIFDWATVTTEGKISEAKPFKFPTIFMCKPNSIEKVKRYKLKPDMREMDYRILHFKQDDEVISDINVPQIIDNVEILFRMMVIVGNKIPPSVPYDKLQEYFTESMSLNGQSYGLNMQMFGIMISELCRDANSIETPYRLPDMKKGYQQISVKNVPKTISPFVAITSENFDESLMASIILSDKPDEEIKSSPLERLISN